MTPLLVLILVSAAWAAPAALAGPAAKAHFAGGLVGPAALAGPAA